MTGHAKTDAELLGAFVAHGDKNAFAEIVNRHGPMVGRVSARIVGNHADAQDITQAVFLVLVRKARTLRQTSALASWLHGVARTMALHAVRGRARRKQREEDFGMGNGWKSPAPEGANDEARASEIAGFLDAALTALTAGQRQAVILRYLEGRPVAEAAAMAGCTETALTTRAGKGIARMRKRFAKRGLVLGTGGFIAAIEAEAGTAISAATLASVHTATEGLVAGATASAVNSTVNSLVEGGIRMMFWNQVQVIAGSALAATTLAATSVYVIAQNRSLPEQGAPHQVEHVEILADEPAPAAKDMRHLTEEEAVALIVEAAVFGDRSRLTEGAGISSLDEFDNQTLSVMIIGFQPGMAHRRCGLSISNDISVLVASARLHGDSSTFFPAEYLSNVRIEQQQDRATGQVDVNAPGYKGHIEFVAFRDEVQWSLGILRIPGYPRRTVKDTSGRWRIETDLQSLEFLRKWAEEGDAEAQYIMGKLLSDLPTSIDVGLKKDVAAATEYFSKAKAQGGEFGRYAEWDMQLLREQKRPSTETRLVEIDRDE